MAYSWRCSPRSEGGQIVTMDNQIHNIDKWDLIIAFPPCTHLAVSGAAHFEKKRIDGRQREGIEFFCQFLNLNCKHVCIENPVNIISGNYITQYFPDLCQKYNLPIKASQTVSPHWFGSTTRKKTNYWLKGLPELKATNIVEPKLKTYIYADGTKKTFSEDFCVGTGKDRGKARSKTAIGIAEAMADQWGKYLLEEETDNESS